MMLPILISVSLAPGSYCFCAFAAVAVIAAAAATTAAATRLGMRTGIVLSRLQFILSKSGKLDLSLQASVYSTVSKRRAGNSLHERENPLCARWLDRLFRPRHDLDHLAFVVVGRMGPCPRIGRNGSASYQWRVGQQALRQRNCISGVLVPQR